MKLKNYIGTPSIVKSMQGLKKKLIGLLVNIRKPLVGNVRNV